MTLVKLTSFLAAILIFASIALAQNSRLPAFPKRPFNHDGKFVTEYEAGENTTHVFLEPVFIDSAKTSLRLAANFQYQGKIPVKPKHISLAFYALYPDCKFSSKPKLTMLVDGELVKFGFTFKSFRERKPDEEGVAFSFGEMERGKCNEILAMFISQRNFLRLVNAKHVAVQVDDFEFKLAEANLEALRDLASRMVK